MPCSFKKGDSGLISSATTVDFCKTRFESVLSKPLVSPTNRYPTVIICYCDIFFISQV